MIGESRGLVRRRGILRSWYGGIRRVWGVGGRVVRGRMVSGSWFFCLTGSMGRFACYIESVWEAAIENLDYASAECCED